MRGAQIDTHLIGLVERRCPSRDRLVYGLAPKAHGLAVQGAVGLQCEDWRRVDALGDLANGPWQANDVVEEVGVTVGLEVLPSADEGARGGGQRRRGVTLGVGRYARGDEKVSEEHGRGQGAEIWRDW